MINKLLGLVFGVKDAKFRTDDDVVDRLNRMHTTCILLLFSLVITTKQYVGAPIHCWCPAQFTGTHVDFAHDICWVKNTYYVPNEMDLPKGHEPKAHLTYYQWVPLILLCQAILCYMPSALWRQMCRRSGLNVAALMDAAFAGQKTSYSDMRAKTVRYMVTMLDLYLQARTQKRRGCCARFKITCARYCCLVYGKFYGNYLTISYLVVKLLYIANAVGQLYLLDVFMGSGYHLYGIEVLNRFFSGQDDWIQSERFPRVTMCDFKVRHQGDTFQTWRIQCVLPINLFNEKIFMIIWFWFVFLAAVTIISFLKWSWKSLYWPHGIKYVKRQLRAISDSDRKKDVVAKFVTNYLKRDGMFVIRLISNNVGCLASAEVLSGLWENFDPERVFSSRANSHERTLPKQNDYREEEV